MPEPCFHSRSALKKQDWHQDPASNTERVAQGGDLGAISMDASRATVRVIRTDEELMIARSV
jgi:acetate kinase